MYSISRSILSIINNQQQWSQGPSFSNSSRAGRVPLPAEMARPLRLAEQQRLGAKGEWQGVGYTNHDIAYSI